MSVSALESKVVELRRQGLTYRQIAERFSCSVISAQRAYARAIGSDSSTRKTVPSEFVRAGHQAVEHRETGDGATTGHIELDGVYRRRSLQIHECHDLLREWGVRS